MSAGWSHTCAITTGRSTVCWGNNGRWLEPPPESFLAISAGYRFSCGIEDDRTVACWGRNYYGQAEAPEGMFTSISAGLLHSCGVRTDGSVACWGSDLFGQADPPAGSFLEVSAGHRFSCGIRTDRTVDCWGNNHNGEAEAPEGMFTSISAGLLHSCGVRTDGSVACWGSDLFGQADPPAGSFSDVTAGHRFSCGIRTDRTVSCWGLENTPASVPSASVGRSGPVVYLTFDDGPHPVYTPLLLDVLSRYGVRATFFVIGARAERYPDVIQRIVSEGHTLANHTWSHEDLATLTRAEFDETVGRTQDLLGDHAAPCIRPPYGSTNEFTEGWAAAHGLRVVLWTASANAWAGLAAPTVAGRLLEGITDGSIVLMHPNAETVQAVEIVLDRLSGRGIKYEPVCQIAEPSLPPVLPG